MELDVANYGAEFYQAGDPSATSIQSYILSKYTDGAEIAYADNFKLKRTGSTLTLTSNIASDTTTSATATIEPDGKVRCNINSRFCNYRISSRRI